MTVAFGSGARAASRLACAVALSTVCLLGMTSCNEDQQSCNDMAGNGKYSPVHEDGKVYCENAFNGDRFLLRDE